MEESVSVDIQSQFNSFNGGISMWLLRLATDLVEHGAYEIVQQMQKEFAHTQDHTLQTNWHFLIEGIRSIDKKKLENAIAPLKKPYQKMQVLCGDYQECVESRKQAEHQWHSAAERAKYQLEVWEKWACETEIARRKKIFTRVPTITNFGFYLKFSGGGCVLDSPQKLQYNLTFFKSKVEAIKGVISNSYIAEELPQDRSPSDFYKAIESLEEHQEQAIHFSNAVSRICEEYKSLEASYSSQIQALNRLLWQMPETAHWALFRICRADLRESVKA
jgi:hypothetical protein